MALFDSIDTIREKAADAAQAAAKKTKQLAEIAKSNVSIYSEEDKIKKAQQELGKLYYRDYVVGEEMDTAEYLPWCQQIDESKQTIADLRDYIDELKRERVDMNASEEVYEEDFVDMEETFKEAENGQAAAMEASAESSWENTAAPDIQVVVCDDPAQEKAVSETEDEVKTED